MARHKDMNWNLPEGKPCESGGNAHKESHIQISLLMDLRDELKRLNSLLHCGSFIRIPSVLDQIAKHTKRPKRGRPAKAATA